MWIYFASNRDGTTQFYRKQADGSGAAEKLTTFEERPFRTIEDDELLPRARFSRASSRRVLMAEMSEQRKDQIMPGC